MNQQEIRNYRAATAARRQAEVEGRTVQDAVMIDSFNRATAAGLRVLRDIDHAAALLEITPCELCGRPANDINHRGTGHTHTPAVTPVGRAHALIAQCMRDDLIVPQYVFSTALMMVSPESPRTTAEVVDIDRAEAVVEDRRRTAGRLLDGPCQCGSGQTARDCTARAMDGV